MRAEETYALLAAEGTGFVVVAAPERDALREAAFFVERLAEEGMPLGGVVINRVHRTAAPGLGAREAREAADRLDGGSGGGSGDGVSGGDEGGRGPRGRRAPGARGAGRAGAAGTAAAAGPHRGAPGRARRAGHSTGR